MTTGGVGNEMDGAGLARRSGGAKSKDKKRHEPKKKPGGR